MVFYPSCQLSHVQKFKSGRRVKIKFPCYPEESHVVIGLWMLVMDYLF